MKRYHNFLNNMYEYKPLSTEAFYLASEADAVVKDLSLRIAVATKYLKTIPDGVLWMTERLMAIHILTMPIESLHEFIKNNPQYGENI